jgi:hypothetical protein
MGFDTMRGLIHGLGAASVAAGIVQTPHARI